MEPEYERLLEYLEFGETLLESLERLAMDAAGHNSLRGFWNPVEAEREMPVNGMSVEDYERKKG